MKIPAGGGYYYYLSYSPKERLLQTEGRSDSRGAVHEARFACRNSCAGSRNDVESESPRDANVVAGARHEIDKIRSGLAGCKRDITVKKDDERVSWKNGIHPA